MIARLAPAIVIAIALARGVFLLPTPYVDWMHDETYFVALALEHGANAGGGAANGPTAPLYANDTLFQEFKPAFPVPYIAIVDVATRWLGSPEAAQRWIPAVLLAIFLGGIYALTRRLTRCVVAGLAAALIAAHPWPSTFLVSFGVLPGRLLPRDITTALLPWLLLLTLNGSRRIPFLLAGLLTAIHPISAPHVWLLIAASGLAARTLTLRDVLAGAALFVAGALPYLVALMRLPDLSPPPIELVNLRMSYVLPPPIGQLARFVLLQLAPLALIGGIGIAKGRFARPHQRALWAIAAAAAVLAALTPLTAAVHELLPFQPIRAALYLYLPFIIGAGALIARLVGRQTRPLGESPTETPAPGRRNAVAVAAGALILGFLANQARPIEEPGRIAYTLGARGAALAAVEQITRVANAVRPIDALGQLAARAGLAERPQNFLLNTDPASMREVLAASCVDVGGDRAPFLELARFAREQSAPGDNFMIPPVGLDHFRVHARRGIYGCWKDGGVILFSERYAALWNTRFSELVRLYSRHDAAGFARHLDSGDVRFVVCDARKPRLQFPVAFENTRFIVYGGWNSGEPPHGTQH
ncbi:MAG: DUF6798 domain-containing protein [bacterium]